MHQEGEIEWKKEVPMTTESEMEGMLTNREYQVRYCNHILINQICSLPILSLPGISSVLVCTVGTNVAYFVN